MRYLYSVARLLISRDYLLKGSEIAPIIHDFLATLVLCYIVVDSDDWCGSLFV